MRFGTGTWALTPGICRVAFCPLFQTRQGQVPPLPTRRTMSSCLFWINGSTSSNGTFRQEAYFGFFFSCPAFLSFLFVFLLAPVNRQFIEPYLAWNLFLFILSVVTLPRTEKCNKNISIYYTSYPIDSERVAVVLPRTMRQRGHKGSCTEETN